MHGSVALSTFTPSSQGHFAFPNRAFLFITRDPHPSRGDPHLHSACVFDHCGCFSDGTAVKNLRKLQEVVEGRAACVPRAVGSQRARHHLATEPQRGACGRGVPRRSLLCVWLAAVSLTTSGFFPVVARVGVSFFLGLDRGGHFVHMFSRQWTLEWPPGCCARGGTNISLRPCVRLWCVIPR